MKRRFHTPLNLLRGEAARAVGERGEGCEHQTRSKKNQGFTESQEEYTLGRLRFVFFAAHKRGEDADEGYGRAGDKGDMESMREGLLQKIELRGRQGMIVPL